MDNERLLSLVQAAYLIAGVLFILFPLMIWTGMGA